MELEVSKKVREAVKAKLLELGTHIDDELPDYVMILIANRRSVPQMENDLALFLQDNSKKFVSWLTHVLKKLEQVTAATIAQEPPSTSASSDSAIVNPSSKVNSHGTVSVKLEEAEQKKKKLDAKDRSKKTKESSKIRKKKSVKDDSSSTTVKKESKKIKKVSKDIKKEVVCEPDTTTSSQPSSQPDSVQPTSRIFAPAIESYLKSVNSKVGSSSKVSQSQPKVRLTLKRPSFSKGTKPSAVFRDAEETKKKQLLSILSDEEKAEDIKPPKVVKSYKTATETGVITNNSHAPVTNSSISLQDELMLTQTDTLILEAGENEFANVNEHVSVKEEATKPEHINESLTDAEKEINELRRIALESQSRIRRDKDKNKNHHQKKIIQDILMGNKEVGSKQTVSRNKVISSVEKADSSKEANRSRHKSNNKLEKADSSTAFYDRRRKGSPKRVEKSSSHESPDHKEIRTSSRRERESSIRHARSPKRSIFDRLHQDRDRRRSRSLSTSPPRKLVSTIGTIINRTEDYGSVRPVVSSVIRVTDRPKRDLKANNKLLFMAVADAQKSIIQSEQSSPKVAEAKKRKSENEDQPVISKRRFTGLTEATSEELNENQDTNIRRKSVKERLGVKRDVRKSVKERLGIIPSQGFGEMSNDSFDGYNQEDYSIVVNVNDEGGNITGRRNVTLASAVPELDFSKINRISIQVNNSEEDDTSDDSSDDEAARLSKSKRQLESMDHSNASDDDEVCVSIDDDDKLPEIPESETEYVVEEIELDESSMMADLKESPKDVSSCDEVQQPPNANASANENSSEAQKLTSFLSSVEKTELTNPPSSTQYSLPSALPDLRGRLANTSQSAKSAPVTAGTKPKCKFWPSCQFKDSCTFEHPMCRYNASCTNPQCFYRHENKEDSQKKKVCKFYPKCTSMKCKFLHPSPCRFGVGCTDFKCTNYHPGPTIGMQKLKAKGVTVIPSSYQLQWTKSKA